MAADETTAGGVFFVIPHTHWEGAVFKTREAYLELGLSTILRALHLLKLYPGYRFVLDQVCYVKPFLERYPQEAAALRQFVDDGRLAIVGGLDVMPDVNMPGGESFVRQVLYGKRYLRAALGVEVTVGWQLDTFGHHAQMPQLLKLGGYQSFWFFRGVADWSVPSEFLWEGLDGTRLPAFWLPLGYALAYGTPTTLPEFAATLAERYASLEPYSRRRCRVGLAGADVSEPEEHLPALVEEAGGLPDGPLEVRLAVPGDYEAAVAQETDRPVVGGELNPIFQGTYSSRIELKQRTRELERLLTTVEKLGVLLQYLGIPVDDDIVWRAWEPMLFNQAHDLMSGVMTDPVYADTLRGYDLSRSLGEEELQRRWRRYVAAIDTRGEGIPVVVCNSLGWPRTDSVITTVGFSRDGVRGLRLVDPDGHEVPMQVLRARRHVDGALVEAEIAFVARDVPAVGHCVYSVLPLSVAEVTADAPEQPGPAPTIENEFYRLTCDPAGGAITSLVVKPDDWEALAAPANTVAREADYGDLWELYQALDGGSRIAMQAVHGVPQPDEALFSTSQSGEPGVVTRGPVVSELSVAHPFGEAGRFATTVRLYTGLRRIEIHTRILNDSASVRYRMLVPTSIAHGCSTHEIPFGAQARPVGIEFPAQTWVDWGDGHHGIALLNRGLPGNNVADGTLMLSLCRSARITAYGFGGGYEPGMSSDSGLALGTEFELDYALLPHAGDWQEAGVHRAGVEFNNPLLAFPAAPQAGRLPARWGLVEVKHPGVVLSTLKPGRDGAAVLRIYEATGRPAAGVAIQFADEVTRAEEVNLLEDPGTLVEAVGDTITLDLRPFEIKTLAVWLTGDGRPS